MSKHHPDSWYAVRTKSNRERVTADALTGRGYAVCLPAYSDRGRREAPLFPGYLFCRFDVTNRLPVLTVPGVVHIVSCGRIPQAVDDREMASVLSVVESGLPARPHPFLEVGRRIELDRGPLAGAEGVILACDDSENFIVSVSLLQRSIAVRVDRNWISPIPTKPSCHNEVC